MAVDRDPYDRTTPNPNSTLGTGMGTGLGTDGTGLDRTDMTDATDTTYSSRRSGNGHFIAIEDMSMRLRMAASAA